jgi:hypothetical protein
VDRVDELRTEALRVHERIVVLHERAATLLEGMGEPELAAHARRNAQGSREIAAGLHAALYGERASGNG